MNKEERVDAAGSEEVTRVIKKAGISNSFTALDHSVKIPRWSRTSLQANRKPDERWPGRRAGGFGTSRPLRLLENTPGRRGLREPVLG